MTDCIAPGVGSRTRRSRTHPCRAVFLCYPLVQYRSSCPQRESDFVNTYNGYTYMRDNLLQYIGRAKQTSVSRRRGLRGAVTTSGDDTDIDTSKTEEVRSSDDKLLLM